MTKHILVMFLLINAITLSFADAERDIDIIGSFCERSGKLIEYGIGRDGDGHIENLIFTYGFLTESNFGSAMEPLFSYFKNIAGYTYFEFQRNTGRTLDQKRFHESEIYPYIVVFMVMDNRILMMIYLDYMHFLTILWS